MNSQESILTVHPPFPKKQLGRYRNRKGVFIIRSGDTVLYIGTSTNICKAVLRLFQKGGALAAFNVHLMRFEVILSNTRNSNIELTLKKQLQPLYNYEAKKRRGPNYYEKQQSKRIIQAYLEQTRFEPTVKPEHKTDFNQS